MKNIIESVIAKLNNAGITNVELLVVCTRADRNEFMQDIVNTPSGPHHSAFGGTPISYPVNMPMVKALELDIASVSIGGNTFHLITP